MDMDMRVYRYGLCRPTENLEEVREQMHLAHKYRNTLVEIERGRRAAVREAMRVYGNIGSYEQALTEAKKVEDAAAGAIKKIRQRTRARSETQEARDALNAARVARKAASDDLKRARLEIRESGMLQSVLDDINEKAAELQRSARAHCGVYWGTYLMIEDQMQASKKMPLYEGDLPNDPKFVRWCGEGAIGIQIQNGMSAEEVFGGEDTRFRIEMPDEAAWYSESRGERRKKARTVLKVRIGSNDDRSPRWATFPMIMHRPFPKDAVIKRASVMLKKIGPREEWYITIYVQSPHTSMVIGDAITAIDVGWRKFEDGLRVAQWATASGEMGELRLSNELLSGLEKADELRSTRDQNMDLIRAKLKAWLADREIPEWLKPVRAHLHSWKSPARLAAMVNRWKRNRFEGDAEIFDALEAWRYHDFHLWTWESSQRKKTLRHRREVYRCFSSELIGSSQMVILEAFDLRKIARKSDDDTNKEARSNRFAVAVSELRGTILNAARGRVRFVDPAYTTQICYKCRHLNEFDAATELHHTCSKCGTTWDQDENAAVNLLTLFERFGGSETMRGARGLNNDNASEGVQESRWDRVKRRVEEKKKRKPAA